LTSTFAAYLGLAPASVGAIVPSTVDDIPGSKINVSAHEKLSLHEEPGRLGKGALLLSDVSHRDKPWDVHKAQADEVARLYGLFLGGDFARLSERMLECSRWLEYALDPNRDTGEILFRLKSARFCRVRYCPLCQWRRSLMWIARFLKRIAVGDFPKGRWLHVTFTVENVPLHRLKEALGQMNRGWKRMIERKGWPALGFIRSTEITRAENGFAHPHFHALLYVPSSYFVSEYITHEEWKNMWREGLRIDYDPVVYVQAFKQKVVIDPETGKERALAPVEGLKYAVKPSDLIGNGKIEDAEWLALLTTQTANLRFIATGGILKDALREEHETNDDLLRPGDGDIDEAEELARWWFLWFDRRYRRRSLSSPLTKGE
jgi:plasmid rolling circle replication initiator protein Rep